ncbi:putative gibberellin 3-beta-dioxygenase [Dioscorea sansibarensis]
MPSLSDHFEFNSFHEVPDSHAWPFLHDYPSADPLGHDSIPIIDLRGSSSDTIKQIKQACERWGVFWVTGHGVPGDLLDQLELQTCRLFSLPSPQKLKAARLPDGVSGYGLPRISSFFSKLMWYEGFTISGSPLDHARKLWPHDYSEFCETIDRYNKEMKKLAERVMHITLQSLGLNEDDLDWAGPVKDLREVSGVLQLNSYPSCPDPDRAMGLGAHTDSSLLTILHQNSTSGLQVLRAQDLYGPARWITVPPLPGALVINIGDLSHILSNGRFHSVLHRAVVNRVRHRYSMAYICGPPAHAKVSPLRPLSGRPVFRAVTWPEYLGLKGKLFNQALNSVRVADETWEDHNNASVITCV